jgi:para-nitrobenzyl esterase
MIACGVALIGASYPAMADTQAPTAAPAAAYSSTTTQLGTLLANPATKAILLKHIPQFVNGLGDNVDRASGMTLKEIQDALKAYSPDALSDAMLAAIDQDLAKVPAAR